MNYLEEYWNIDFITEFGKYDVDYDATNGDGLVYWKEWKGNKYFNEK